MKRGWNRRLIFLLLLLGALAVREILLERGPTFLRPDLHLFAYVGNTVDGTVSAIDLVKLAAVATIPVGPSPSGLRAHPKREEIWGVSSEGGYAWVLDARHGQILSRIPVGAGPFAVEFSADGRRAFVAASGAGFVTAIDCESKKILGRGRAGRRPWIARVTPNGKLLVVSNREDATISLLDATTLASQGTIPVAQHPEQIAILPDSSKAFISSGSSNMISVVDLQKRRCWRISIWAAGRVD